MMGKERTGYTKDQLRTLTADASSVTNTTAADRIERITVREVTLSRTEI